MSRKALCVLLVALGAAGLSVAQASIIGNCCYSLAKYNISTDYRSHGDCNFVAIEDGATWTLGTCNAQTYGYFCGTCGHQHTNQRHCVAVQDHCSIEKEHECAANFDVGSALKCHKRCQVGGCACEGSGQPPHMVTP